MSGHCETFTTSHRAFAMRVTEIALSRGYQAQWCEVTPDNGSDARVYRVEVWETDADEMHEMEQKALKHLLQENHV